MKFVPQILCELDEARALGFHRAGIPVLSFEATESPQVFKATAVAFGTTVRLYVFESRRWLAAKRMGEVAHLMPCASFVFRAQNLPQEIPAFQHAAHVWGIGVYETTHEVYDKVKLCLTELCKAYRRENPEPLLDVPQSKGTYNVWLPCTLQEKFSEDFEALCLKYAEDYNIVVPWKFKEAAK